MQQLLDELVDAGAVSMLMHYQDGREEWRGSSGVAELGSDRPVDPDGWFRIGSVTKTFTSATVLTLVADGLVTLDDTCELWLPGLVPDGEGIKLRQLLNHTAGLYNYTDDLDALTGIVRERFVHWDPLRAVGMAVAHEPLFAPGTSRSYSNTNYIVAGLIIEAATGNSYASEVRSRILEPLELHQTQVPGDEVSLPEPHAHGYMRVDGELVDMTELNASMAWAAGGIVSRAADLNTFYSALLTGKLLRPEELAALLTTVPTDQPNKTAGLGIGRTELPDGQVIWGHVGGIFGYLTVSYHSADATKQVTLSYTSAGSDDVEVDDLLARVFA